ncbi:hypothetical protein MRY87_04205, partial [bacterium]|nr:hypothetical protein [bacterium]
QGQGGPRLPDYLVGSIHVAEIKRSSDEPLYLHLLNALRQEGENLPSYLGDLTRLTEGAFRLRRGEGVEYLPLSPLLAPLLRRELQTLLEEKKEKLDEHSEAACTLCTAVLRAKCRQERVADSRTTDLLDDAGLETVFSTIERLSKTPYTTLTSLLAEETVSDRTAAHLVRYLTQVQERPVEQRFAPEKAPEQTTELAEDWLAARAELHRLARQEDRQRAVTAEQALCLKGFFGEIRRRFPRVDLAISRFDLRNSLRRPNSAQEKRS